MYPFPRVGIAPFAGPSPSTISPIQILLECKIIGSHNLPTLNLVQCRPAEKHLCSALHESEGLLPLETHYLYLQEVKQKATSHGLYRVLGSWLSMLSTDASADPRSEAFTACIKALLRALLATPFSNHVLWWINRWGVFKLLIELRKSETESVREAALALDVGFQNILEGSCVSCPEIQQS